MQKQRAAPRVRIDFILIDHQVLFYVCLVVYSCTAFWLILCISLAKGACQDKRNIKVKKEDNLDSVLPLVSLPYISMPLLKLVSAICVFRLLIRATK